MFSPDVSPCRKDFKIFSNLAGGEKSVVVCVCFCCDQTGSSVRFKKDGFICCVFFAVQSIHRLLQNLWRKQVCFLSGETNLWLRTFLVRFFRLSWRLEEETKGDGESREGVNWVKVLQGGGGWLSVDYYEKTQSWIIQWNDLPAPWVPNGLKKKESIHHPLGFN